MIISYYQLLWVIKDHELSYNYNLFSSIIINYHQLSYYHQLLSMIINDHQLLSIIINYHQLSSIIINDHQWSSMIINYHQLSSMIIKYYQWSSMIISYYQLLSVINDHELSYNYHLFSSIIINYPNDLIQLQPKLHPRSTPCPRTRSSAVSGRDSRCHLWSKCQEPGCSARHWTYHPTRLSWPWGVDFQKTEKDVWKVVNHWSIAAAAWYLLPWLF